MSKIEYNKIRVVLAEKNIDSKQLAQKVKVSEQTVSSWVNNNAQPSIQRFHLIAKALNCKLFDILNNDI